MIVAVTVLAVVIMKLTTAVADAIINDDSGDEEEILHRDFRWEIMDNYTGHRGVFSCDFGPRNGAENVTLYNVLSGFLTKKSYNK